MQLHMSGDILRFLCICLGFRAWTCTYPAGPCCFVACVVHSHGCSMCCHQQGLLAILHHPAASARLQAICLACLHLTVLPRVPRNAQPAAETVQHMYLLEAVQSSLQRLVVVSCYFLFSSLTWATVAHVEHWQLQTAKQEAIQCNTNCCPGHQPVTVMSCNLSLMIQNIIDPQLLHCRSAIACETSTVRPPSHNACSAMVVALITQSHSLPCCAVSCQSFLPPASLASCSSSFF
jgi:hypothetical protein